MNRQHWSFCVSGLLSLGCSADALAAGPIGLLEAVRITLAQNPKFKSVQNRWKLAKEHYNKQVDNSLPQ